MKVWALYSTRVDTYSAHELIDLFTEQADAEKVRDGLIGNQVYPGLRLVWEDDGYLPDLYVSPLDLR